jgi:hypothetical protein
MVLILVEAIRPIQSAAGASPKRARFRWPLWTYPDKGSDT